MRNSPYHIAILLLLGLALGACENDIAEIRATFSDPETTLEVVRDVEMLYSDSARLKVRILAPELHRYMDRNNPKDHFPSGVYVEFYDEKGQISSWLTAKKADRFERDERIIARDSVVLFSVERDTFRSEELIWDSRAEKVYTDRLFRFTSPEEEIIGYKFVSNQQFTDYTFYKMSGTMKVDALEEELDNPESPERN